MAPRVIINKHATASGSNLALCMIRNAVHAFPRARDLRTRGGVAARISEPSREAATPRRGPSWPAASPRGAASECMHCAASPSDTSSVPPHSCRTAPGTGSYPARRRRGATGSHPAHKFFKREEAEKLGVCVAHGPGMPANPNRGEMYTSRTLYERRLRRCMHCAASFVRTQPHWADTQQLSSHT